MVRKLILGLILGFCSSYLFSADLSNNLSTKGETTMQTFIQTYLPKNYSVRNTGRRAGGINPLPARYSKNRTIWQYPFECYCDKKWTVKRVLLVSTGVGRWSVTKQGRGGKYCLGISENIRTRPMRRQGNPLDKTSR